MDASLSGIIGINERRVPDDMLLEIERQYVRPTLGRRAADLAA